MTDPQPNLHLVLPDAIPEIPMFEGQPVHTSKLIITSTMGLDIDNAVLRQNDIVRITVEARIAKVHHNENRKGELERVQVAKALAVQITPWNSDDPTDNGVFRG